VDRSPAQRQQSSTTHLLKRQHDQSCIVECCTLDMAEGGVKQSLSAGSRRSIGLQYPGLLPAFPDIGCYTLIGTFNIYVALQVAWPLSLRVLNTRSAAEY